MTSVAMETAEVVEIKPQAGPQEQFLSTPADIAIYGGAAGGGKTWAELVEPLRFLLPSEKYPNGVKGFFGVIFRRTAPMIRNEGGLWDESNTIYPLFDAKPRETILEWVFPNGCTMRFASMQHEKDRLNWQGSQIPYIAFDELTHFTEEQFFYMLSRNRSMCGVKPYVRATTNPDADSWVAEFIAWWIDQDEGSPTYGLPIPERAGVLRYFIRIDGQITWGDTKEELFDRLPKMPDDVDKDKLVKSVTFIPATIYDNKKLIDQNPEYLANLLSQSYVERERLLGGNWKVKPTAGKIFNSTWWSNKIIKAAPIEGVRWARYWDKAGTEEMEATGKTPYTVGCLIGKDRNNIYYIKDVRRDRLSALKRERLIKQTAFDDERDLGDRRVRIFVEQEPGSGGLESAQASTRNLSGFIIHVDRVTGDKISRALPASAQVEAGNVYLVEGDWNKAFIQELHAFPDNAIKDQVDAFSGGFNKLARLKSYDLNDWPTSGR